MNHKRQILILLFLFSTLTVLGQHQHYVVVGFDTRVLAKPTIFSTNASVEVVLGKRLSTALSIGPAYGFKNQSADITGGGWFDSNLKALDLNPQLRLYLTGEDGAPDGLYLNGSLRAIIGSEKNHLTYFQVPDYIDQTYRKSGSLIGPEFGIGYQLGKEFSILTFGVYVNGCYLFTNADYPASTYKFGFKGNFLPGPRIDAGFTIGYMLNKGGI